MAATRPRSSHWSDLQPELLGLVLRRLPSLADRVRLRAVCRSWRRGARLEAPLPPPLLWLNLPDGTFLSIPGGEIHSMSIPEDVRSCHGSVGNWLFLEHIGGRCSLTNPFSKDIVQLPNLATIWRHKRRYPVHAKLVLLSSLDPSPDSMFAALITDNISENLISICQPPTTGTAFRMRDRKRILDITLFDGKLYALTHKKLFVLEIDLSYKGKPIIPSMKCIVDSIDDSGTTSSQSFATNKGYIFQYWGYLVESSGRMLHVRRLIGVLSNVPDDNLIRMQHAHTLSFDLFEADLATDSCGRWRRVHTLGGQALFVGRHSKSFPASDCGAQEDCIYFMHDYHRGNCDPFGDCGVFNMRNGMITPLLP